MCVLGLTKQAGWSDWDCGVCSGAGETGGRAGVIGTVVCILELAKQVGGLE